MSKRLDQMKTAYSGWHRHASEFEGDAPAKDAAQLDIEAEIERRVAQRMAAKKKKAPEAVEEPAE